MNKIYEKRNFYKSMMNRNEGIKIFYDRKFYET